MKRSEINLLIREAEDIFSRNGWALPPLPRWDVTDFGLGNWRNRGLVLVNLAEEEEYCEKLMYAREGMVTPFHAHRVKKEDIICRLGKLSISLAKNAPLSLSPAYYKVNGIRFELSSDITVLLEAGERITLIPGIFHEFQPVGGPCIIGEVSTANDDKTDNVFLDAKVGRYSQIQEDEPAVVKLIGEE